MPGRISELIPEELSPESEAVLRELLKRKVKAACGMLVRVVRILEQRYGPEVKQVVREQIVQRTPREKADFGPAEEDLHAFCRSLERGCTGSHEWERVADEPDRVGYRFTSCLWAEVFRELGAPDIGWWWCEGDEPAVRAYHPQLRFKRTKTLMEGADCCDHVFYVQR